jgi:hypothetical protein
LRPDPRDGLVWNAHLGWTALPRAQRLAAIASLVQRNPYAGEFDSYEDSFFSIKILRSADTSQLRMAVQLVAQLGLSSVYTNLMMAAKTRDLSLLAKDLVALLAPLRTVMRQGAIVHCHPDAFPRIGEDVVETVDEYKQLTLYLPTAAAVTRPEPLAETLAFLVKLNLTDNVIPDAIAVQSWLTKFPAFDQNPSFLAFVKCVPALQAFL